MGSLIRVLVVDNDPNVRFTVRVALEGAPPMGEPMEVVEASGGNAALSCIAGDAFDVILLDVAMPDLDGLAVLNDLRSKQGDQTPVVMLTARGREADVATAFRAGADAYLTKPFDVDELASVTAFIATLPPRERATQRAQELQRAELLLQIEHNFDD